MKTGMTSVTFRGQSARYNLDAARRAGLDGMEWADKYHVLSGDEKTARQVGGMTRSEGLETLSYGSFYNPSLHDDGYFEGTLASALALETRMIRIWAGNQGSAQMDPAGWERVICSLQKCCDLAARHGVTVACEFHPDTLADTAPSALRLIREVGNGFRTYWQPDTQDRADWDGRQELCCLLDHLANVHVFAFRGGRHPLGHECRAWLGTHGQPGYIDRIRRASGEHALILEFVWDERVETLLSDAKTLKGWLEASERLEVDAGRQ